MLETMTVLLNNKRVEVPVLRLDIRALPDGPVIFQQKTPVLPDLGKWISVRTVDSDIPMFVSTDPSVVEPWE